MRPPRRPKHVQPDLFTAPPARPPWETLPAEARARALALLARLLRAAHDRGPAASADQGVGRE
jgi:hypothetical protein